MIEEESAAAWLEEPFHFHQAGSQTDMVKNSKSVDRIKRLIRKIGRIATHKHRIDAVATPFSLALSFVSSMPTGEMSIAIT